MSLWPPVRFERSSQRSYTSSLGQRRISNLGKLYYGKLWKLNRASGWVWLKRHASSAFVAVCGQKSCELKSGTIIKWNLEPVIGASLQLWWLYLPKRSCYASLLEPLGSFKLVHGSILVHLQFNYQVIHIHSPSRNYDSDLEAMIHRAMEQL